MTRTTPNPLNRRALLAGAALAPLLPRLAAASTAPLPAEAPCTYEVTRTDAQWRAMLNDLEYAVMREGGTEKRHTSLLAFEERPGRYDCRGCGLAVFDSDWKVQHFDIGWVFFTQSRPDAILTAIDPGFTPMEGEIAPAPTIECHCRRCGSHFGHILHVRDQVVHCLNGTSLTFTAA
jgi:peptide-methionine (R)-S-oxide reductase